LLLKDGEQGRDWGKRPVKVRSAAGVATLMVVLVVAVVVVHAAVGRQGKRQVCRAIQDIGNAMAALNVGGVVVVVDLTATELTTMVLMKVVVGLHERGQALGRGRLLALALVLVRIGSCRVSVRAHTAVPGRGWWRIRRRLKHGRVVSCSPGLVTGGGRVNRRHPGPGGKVHHGVLRL